MIRGAIIVSLFLALTSGTVWASSGVVIDPKGERLEGVSVCYRIGNVDELCSSTDEQGRWVLPKSDIDRVALTFKGYLTRFIDGGVQSEPVILEPGATLLVRLEDAAGRSLAEGEIEVLYSSGRRIGPIPISRAAGTLIRSLQPGPVVIVGRSAGFVDGRAGESELHAGKETVAVVKLKPVRD